MRIAAIWYMRAIIIVSQRRATCTVCYALHGWSRGQKNEQQNNVPNPKKKNTAAGYQGPVKIEFLEGASLLHKDCYEKNYMLSKI